LAAPAGGKTSARNGAPETLSPMPLPTETLEAHGERHPDPKRHRHVCDRCRWICRPTDWARLSTVSVQGNHFTTITDRPLVLGGPWALGCVACARMLQQKCSDSNEIKNARAWAKFEVRGSSVGKKAIKKHVASMCHQLALQTITGNLDIGASLPTAGSQTPRGPHAYGVTMGTMSGQVPRPDRFVGAISTAMKAESGRAFAKRMADTDLTSALPSSGVMRDASRQTHRKCITSAAAVLIDDDQKTLRSSVRLAFSEDDRNQVRVLRVRVVHLKPKIGVREFLGGVIRDYGFSAEANRDATWNALQNMCRKLRGHRDSSGTQGPEDSVDMRLLARVQQITFSGASDGAEVAKTGIQMLQADGLLPNLRYQFRDRPHTTRTVIKNTFALCSSSDELRVKLITGEGPSPSAHDTADVSVRYGSASSRRTRHICSMC